MLGRSLLPLVLTGCTFVVGTTDRTVATETDAGTDASDASTRAAVTCDPNACKQQRDACLADCQATAMACTQKCGNDEKPSKMCQMTCTEMQQQCTAACDAPCSSCAPCPGTVC